MTIELERRKAKIFSAYQCVGELAPLYDGMMASSTPLGRLALRIFWGLSAAGYAAFLRQAFAGVPENFSGRLLEVPVGTGIISLPRYERLRDAEIICVDYSEKMLAAAIAKAAELKLRQVAFRRADVGALPFGAGTFDLVLSVNGFHAFPDKAAAFNETCRVLKAGGIFCGCMYVVGQNRRTDFFVKNFCERQGFFTPPYENISSLREKLNKIYRRVEITNVNSFAGFICRK